MDGVTSWLLGRSIGLSCEVVVTSSMNPFEPGELHVTKSLTALAAFRLVFPKRVKKRSNRTFFCLRGSIEHWFVAQPRAVSSSSDPVLKELLDMSSVHKENQPDTLNNAILEQHSLPSCGVSDVKCSTEVILPCSNAL